MKVKSLSRVRLLATPWTAAYQAPLSMGFSRQEYWSGVPLPSPSLINTDAKILNRILVKQLQTHFKRITHHDQVGFIPEVQECFNIYRSIYLIHNINKMNDKSCAIVSVDGEKAFDKIWHPFMIKNLSTS